MSNFWKSFKEWTGISKNTSNQDLKRSRYSLVSTGELTSDTIQLWLGLPEEVKNDPALAPFRQMYEKELDHREKTPLNLKKSPDDKSKRLPLVRSAPSLGSLQADTEASEDAKGDEKCEKEDIIIKTPTNNRMVKLLPAAQARYYAKMTVLLACWIFFTAVFLMYSEKKEVIRNTSISFGEQKSYTLQASKTDMSILVKLSGPFLSKQEEMMLNKTELDKKHRMVIWLERVLNNEENYTAIDEELSPHWTIHLQEQQLIDFNKGEPRSSVFKLKPSLNSNRTYVICMNTTSIQTTPFTLSYHMNPLDVRTGVVYAVILLTGLYLLIIFEVINRTMAAVVVSTMSLAALSLVGERPSLPEIVSWLDVETLLLLFSMMVLVAIVAETGIFDFLAVFTFEVTKEKLWPLIFLMCGITAILSMFLDNVTTVLLMSPVTIRLCEVMDLDPVPLLMFMSIYSNIGGTATPVGDPPNVIVVSNKDVIQSGINFTNFAAHMSLGALLVCVQTTLQIRFMFRDTNKLRLNVPRDIQDLRHQISIWRRAAESLPHLSKDVLVVRERLERKILKLNLQLEVLVKESSKRACPKETFDSTLLELKNKYKIRNKILLAKASFAICFVVLLFFLHSVPELNRVSLGWTALLGAILLLILEDREDVEPILHRVEWSTLLFFAALFVLMEALSKLGLIMYVGGLMEQLILKVDESARLAVAIILIIWVSGIISAFVDNIPLTTMMVRVVVPMGSNPNLNLPMGPLIWALLYGACLGGNGTLIGSSANVVCAGVAEQHGYKFTFTRFFKVGFPVMIGHLLVSSGYLLLCHCVLSWH